MDAELVKMVLQFGVSAIFGIIAFFIRGYFKSLREDMIALRGDMKDMADRMADFQDELSANTVEIAKASTDLRSVWRVLGNKEHANGSLL